MEQSKTIFVYFITPHPPKKILVALAGKYKKFNKE